MKCGIRDLGIRIKEKGDENMRSEMLALSPSLYSG